MRIILSKPTLITYSCSYVFSQNNYLITHKKTNHKILSLDEKLYQLPFTLKLEYNIKKNREETIDKYIFKKYLDKIDETTKEYNMNELLYFNGIMLKQIIHIINYNTLLGIAKDERL